MTSWHSLQPRSFKKSPKSLPSARSDIPLTRERLKKEIDIFHQGKEIEVLRFFGSVTGEGSGCDTLGGIINRLDQQSKAVLNHELFKRYDTMTTIRGKIVLGNVKTILIKIGSAVLTGENGLDLNIIEQLVDDMVDLKKKRLPHGSL